MIALKFLRISMVVCFFALLGGCLTDGQSANGSSVVGGGGIGAIAVNGVLMKGAVGNADITLHLANTDGTVGAKIKGPFKTDNDGQWSNTLPAGSNGIMLVKSSGGTYTDEATGKTVDIGTNSGFIGILDLNSSPTAVLTPWSYATYLAARAGMVSTFDNAVQDAVQGATASLGFNPLTTVLHDPSGSQVTATANEKLYAALTAAFSQLHKDESLRLTAFNNTNPFDLILAFARDVSDGKLDGVDAAGNAISVSTGLGGGTGTAALVPLSPSLSNLSPLLTAASRFVTATPGLGGVVIDPDMPFAINVQN